MIDAVKALESMPPEIRARFAMRIKGIPAKVMAIQTGGDHIEIERSMSRFYKKIGITYSQFVFQLNQANVDFETLQVRIPA